MIFYFMFMGLASCTPLSETTPTTTPETTKDPMPKRISLSEDKLEDSTFEDSGELMPNVIKPLGEQTHIEDETSEEALDIVVVGVFSGAKGTAIIRTSDNKETVYRIGDEIRTGELHADGMPRDGMPRDGMQSGVTLKSVGKNFIVIDIKGHMKRLPVSKGWTVQENSAPPANLSTPGFKVNASGDVTNSKGVVIGRVNPKGDIVDLKGRLIGRVTQPKY